MFENEEIPSSYIEDYKTLHHDIGLFQRSNGLWDLWFGQDKVSENFKNNPYLDIVDGDLVSATEVHSLQVGIIIACLTSWNYLNRTGNPLYTEFGNESYSLLKKNKGVNTQYKIKQFFMDCLNRMRRVYSVEYLEVNEVVNNPYLYRVVFKVLSVTNTLVDGAFYLSVDSNKNTSVLEVSYNHPYTSVANPLMVDCILKDEYGSVIEGEILYVYIRTGSDAKFKFYGITEATDSKGSVRITIPANGLNVNAEVMFVFKGNTLYNPCSSKIVGIEIVSYYIKSRYTYQKVLDKDGSVLKDDNNRDVEVLDKQILYIEDSLGNSIDKFRLGELLSDYVDITKLNLTKDIPLTDIESNYIPNKLLMEYDSNNNKIFEKHKLYLIPTNRTITGTNKVYYDAFSWNNDGTVLNKTSYEVQLNTNKPNEIHFLINIEDNGFFEVDFYDGHLYYKTDIYDNEI